MAAVQSPIIAPPDPRSERDAALFPVLTAPQIACVVEYGVTRDLADGDTIFNEGDLEDDFHVVLEGAIRVTRLVAGERILLAVHHAGQFSGALTMLAGGISIATGRAMGKTRVAAINSDAFLKLIAECPDVAKIILGAMARRRPEAEAISQQRQKMAALGKLAAGLAHELNNPAAAAGRAAAHLQEATSHQQALAIELCRRQPTLAQLDHLKTLRECAVATASSAPVLDPLERSDREQEMADWLEVRKIPDAWNLAATLASSGLDKKWLEEAAEGLSTGCMGSALSWVEAALSVRSLVSEVEESVNRISDLVQAIKDYSYMDQAPLQEIDIHCGLESTLTILGYRLRKAGIEVIREFDSTIPKVCAYGSELNQVWTNLIANAIDAINGPGHITLRTKCKGDWVVVEVADDGPGIPKELQARIFDPFFTTKDVGQGTGLGLDITYRIVVDRHHGDLRVDSKPGDTRFTVKLPIAQN